MRWSWLSGLVVVASLLVSGCGGDDQSTSASGTTEVAASAPDPSASPIARQFSSSDTGEDVYDGTLTIDVDYYGYDCGLNDLELHLEGRRRYEMPVQVIRGPPAEAEGIRESSPYNLIVSANPGNEAGITTVSATVATTPTNRPVLFEYWRMAVQGEAVQGQLVNSWRQAGVVANLFPTDRLLVPCRPELGIIPRSIQPIEEGARLDGQITDDRADLQITGQTTDHERRFTAHVSATRG